MMTPIWLEVIDITALLLCGAGIIYLLKTHYRE